MDDVPHLSLPLRLNGDGYQTVQQDTDDEIAVTVKAVLSFPLGSRIEAPAFGIPDPTLTERPLDVEPIRDAIDTYEPRADYTVTEQPYNPADPTAATVRVEVALAVED